MTEIFVHITANLFGGTFTATVDANSYRLNFEGRMAPTDMTTQYLIRAKTGRELKGPVLETEPWHDLPTLEELEDDVHEKH